MTKKNKFGGKHHKKTKTVSQEKKSIVFKENGQEYAKVVKKLGNGFLLVSCFSGINLINRRAHIRGTMRKRNWINPGDIVLVNIRDYQQDSCDIVLKYSEDEIRILRIEKMIWSTNTDGTNNYDAFCENETNIDDEFDDLNNDIDKNRNYCDDTDDSNDSDNSDNSDNSDSDDNVDRELDEYFKM